MTMFLGIQDWLFQRLAFVILAQMGCEIRYHNYERDTGFSNFMIRFVK